MEEFIILDQLKLFTTYSLELSVCLLSLSVGYYTVHLNQTIEHPNSRSDVIAGITRG